MEFIKTNQFRVPSQKEVKSTLMIPKQQKRAQKIRITCCCFMPELEALSCGLNDGSIMQFLPKKFTKSRLTEMKDYETRQWNTISNGHKGEIKCILSEKIFSQVFLITGSADRTIKIWETDPKAKDVVQTLTGHCGTVLCLIYSRKTDTLFSSSTDKTLRIWKQDEDRKFFHYPWYICYQKISDFASKKIDSPLYPTAFELQDGELNSFVLYVGDSAGGLHIIKQIEIDNEQSRQQIAFEIDRSNFSCHRLNINSIMYVPQEHLVITSGFDQMIYAYQSLSDKLVLKYANPRKCVFTSLGWHDGMIIASDEQGCFYCLQINSDKGIEEIKKYTCRIHQIIAVPNRNDLFVVTDQGVDSIKIIKGIKVVAGEYGHTAPIIGMYSLEPYKLTQKKIKDQAKLITVSLDNSMRVWDPTDLSFMDALQSPEKCEMSTLFYLKQANLFVTGHENGLVRLWNIQLQTSITISQQHSIYAHTNNICAFTEYIYVRSNEDVAQFLFSTGYEGKVNVWEIFLKKSTAQSSLMSTTICPQLKFSFFPQELQERPDESGFQLFALCVWQSKEAHNTAILSAGSKGMVYFSRMFSYETFRKIKVHDDSINCMCIDENILFTGSCDHSIKLTSLDNFEQLICLNGHDASLAQLALIEETGHFVSCSNDGQVIFWDYPRSKIVKKIKEKKQKIVTFCIVDELQMMYCGTRQATILSYDLSTLYQQKVNGRLSHKASSSFDEQDLDRILKENQEQLDKLMVEK